MSEQTTNNPSGIQVEIQTAALSNKKTKVRLTLDWIVEGNPLNTDMKAESRKALEWALKESGDPHNTAPKTF